MAQYNILVTSPKLTDVDGKPNIVTSVYVALYAVYDTGDGQSIGMHVDLGPPQDPFTPFDQLSEEQVKQWVMSTPTYQEMVSIVDRAHDDYINTQPNFGFNIKA